VFSAFQKLQNGKEIKYFYQCDEVEMVDACVFPDEEQRVTLKRDMLVEWYFDKESCQTIFGYIGVPMQTERVSNP
jgi:hypothetical protein